MCAISVVCSGVSSSISHVIGYVVILMLLCLLRSITQIFDSSGWTVPSLDSARNQMIQKSQKEVFYASGSDPDRA